MNYTFKRVGDYIKPVLEELDSQKKIDWKAVGILSLAIAVVVGVVWGIFYYLMGVI